MTRRDLHALTIALGLTVTVVAVAGTILIAELRRDWLHAAARRIQDARNDEAYVESAAQLYFGVENKVVCPTLADLLREGYADARRADLARCTTKCQGADERFPSVTAHCTP